MRVAGHTGSVATNTRPEVARSSTCEVSQEMWGKSWTQTGRILTQHCCAPRMIQEKAGAWTRAKVRGSRTCGKSRESSGRQSLTSATGVSVTPRRMKSCLCKPDDRRGLLAEDTNEITSACQRLRWPLTRREMLQLWRRSNDQPRAGVKLRHRAAILSADKAVRLPTLTVHGSVRGLLSSHPQPRHTSRRI